MILPKPTFYQEPHHSGGAFLFSYGYEVNGHEILIQVRRYIEERERQWSMIAILEDGTIYDLITNDEHETIIKEFEANLEEAMLEEALAVWSKRTKTHAQFCIMGYGGSHSVLIDAMARWAALCFIVSPGRV